MTSWEFAVVAYSEQYFLEDKNLQQKSLDIINFLKRLEELDFKWLCIGSRRCYQYYISPVRKKQASATKMRETS